MSLTVCHPKVFLRNLHIQNSLRKRTLSQEIYDKPTNQLTVSVGLVPSE